MNKKLSRSIHANSLRTQSEWIQSFYGYASGHTLPHTQGAKTAFCGTLQTDAASLTVAKFSLRSGSRPASANGWDNIKISIQKMRTDAMNEPDGVELATYTGAFPVSNDNTVLSFNAPVTIDFGEPIAIVIEWDTFDPAKDAAYNPLIQSTVHAHNTYSIGKSHTISAWDYGNAQPRIPLLVLYNSDSSKIGYISIIPPIASQSSTSYNSGTGTNFRGSVFKALDYCTIDKMTLLTRVALLDATCNAEAAIYRSNGTKIYSSNMLAAQLLITAYNKLHYHLGASTFDMEPNEEIYYGYEALGAGNLTTIEATFLPAVLPALPLYNNIGIVSRTGGVFTTDYTKRANNSLGVCAMGLDQVKTFRKRTGIGG